MLTAELPCSFPLAGELVGDSGPSAATFFSFEEIPSSFSFTSELLDDTGSSCTSFVSSAKLYCFLPLPGELGNKEDVFFPKKRDCFFSSHIFAFALFAHGCYVTSMSLEGSPMALAHSLDSD